MKKIILLAGVIVALLCFGHLNAQTNAQASGFGREFKDASRVRWEKISAEVSLARFTQNGENSIAYFGRSGKLLTYGKQIEFSQSPEKVQEGLSALAKSLETKEGALRVIHVFELTQENATKYYVNMGNENVLLAVMASPKGKTSIIKRTKLDPNMNQGPIIASF